MTSTSAAVTVRALHRTFATGKGLRKRGPEVNALDGVDLTIATGEVHGLLGPNGAGKTTLCKVLSTVLLPTSGTAEIMGYDVVRDTSAVRPLIGIVFGGERGLYFRLTARQNLTFWAAMYGLGKRQAQARADELIERVGLTARAGEPVPLLVAAPAPLAPVFIGRSLQWLPSGVASALIALFGAGPFFGVPGHCPRRWWSP